jgi:hypothetical protein
MKETLFILFSFVFLPLFSQENPDTAEVVLERTNPKPKSATYELVTVVYTDTNMYVRLANYSGPVQIEIRDGIGIVNISASQSVDGDITIVLPINTLLPGKYSLFILAKCMYFGNFIIN